MKRLMVSGAVLVICLTATVQGQVATTSEAQTVANNWVKLILEKKGTWGGSVDATVASVSELKRGGRTIGYFCEVVPQGYIIVSLRKELAPIKATSEDGDLNPDCEESLAGLIKGKMERILGDIEQRAGPVRTAQSQDVKALLEIDYSAAWDELTNPKPTSLKAGETFPNMNYQQSHVLLTSSWHQGAPYNLDCDAPPSDSYCYEPHCAVGCYALAGAQVMRYWAWPPLKTPATVYYDWVNMADRVTNSSPQVQKDAVARLCHEVGVEAGVTYCDEGCASEACFSTCPGRDLLDAFEDHFYYHDSAYDYYRSMFLMNPDGWFSLIQGELNANRPIPYRVANHAIVCDGWRIVGSTRQYHMNYGWGDSGTGAPGCCDPCNIWYTLDALCLGGLDEEILLKNIYPECALGSSLSGTPADNLVLYPVPASSYRYFDQDTTGRNVTFAAGHNLQFLPGVTARGTSPIGDVIRFLGSSGNDRTRMFSIKGTATGGSDAGVRIYNAEIRLHNAGSIRFH